MDAREVLMDAVRAHAGEAAPWEQAEVHLLEQEFRARLAALHVEPTPDVAATLMAVAYFFGQHTPEWGGDVRCTLGEIALLGLRLFDDPDPDRPDPDDPEA
jgi:hypothetical protein